MDGTNGNVCMAGQMLIYGMGKDLDIWKEMIDMYWGPRAFTSGEEDAKQEMVIGKLGRKNTTCYRCGDRRHSMKECEYKHFECRQCRWKGHFKLCKGRSEKGHKMNQVKSGSEDIGSETMGYLSSVDVMKKDHKLKGIIDTGAAVTVLSEKVWNQIGCPRIFKSNKRLESYGGRTVRVKGFYLGKSYSK